VGKLGVPQSQYSEALRGRSIGVKFLSAVVQGCPELIPEVLDYLRSN
jgi:hypothetical protein